MEKLIKETNPTTEICNTLATKIVDAIDYPKLAQHIAESTLAKETADPKIISAKRACEILGVCRRTFGKLLKEFPGMKQKGKYSRGYYLEEVKKVKAHRDK